ncbi:MAG TPA: mechanosensitive ion channel domain-containing protein [Marinobacter sp.]|nr:mechanosensitive ion channel domain-containing protein [Marinobacter sp.]
MEDIFGADGQTSAWLDQGIALVLAYAPKVVLAIITLIVGLWLIKRFVNVVDTRLGKKDPTLNKFLCGLISIILKILLLISVASMVGIATTSFVAIIGAAGLAVGLALQGSLANFAGGVLILIFKPFKVGDAIEAQGFLGTVKEITILYTIIDTFDNRRIIIPNGQLSNASLTNMSTNEIRRCDMSFSISYDDDISKAKAVCQRLIEEDERALDTPAPLIVVGELADSSVNLTVRAWTRAGDLWPFYWDMQERVKLAFDSEGITIPFPRQVLYLQKHEE